MLTFYCKFNNDNEIYEPSGSEIEEKWLGVEKGEGGVDIYKRIRDSPFVPDDLNYSLPVKIGNFEDMVKIIQRFSKVDKYWTPITEKILVHLKKEHINGKIYCRIIDDVRTRITELCIVIKAGIYMPRSLDVVFDKEC